MLSLTEDTETPAKRSKTNVVTYLMEKAKLDKELKEEELKVRKEEMELEKEKFELEKKERLQKLDTEKQNANLMLTILQKLVDK